MNKEIDSRATTSEFRLFEFMTLMFTRITFLTQYN